MFGSRTPWNDLLTAGLVDELHLMLVAAGLGGGISIFGTGTTPHIFASWTSGGGRARTTCCCAVRCCALPRDRLDRAQLCDGIWTRRPGETAS